jgi:dihydrofolate reductase
MAKLVYGADMTLDGVVEGPERCRFDYISPELQQYDQSKVNSLDAMLLGRKTFEGFAAFWSTQAHNEYGIADKLNSAPKFVVSSTLKKADWNNSSIIKGDDLKGEVGKLKEQQSGDIGITGSISVAQALMQRNLIDQYDFLIFPLVLGSGRRLFDGVTNMPMELLETKSFGHSVVLAKYLPAKK